MMPEQTAPADTTEPRPMPRSAAPTVARPTAEPADAVPADARPADRRIGAVSIAFLVIATIAGAVFAVLTPAFWGHDEITQFGRAYQVAHGGVFPQEIDDERGIAFGGDIPDSVDALMHYALNDYRDNPEEPLPMVASPDGYDRLESAPISETTTRMWFTNTAAYSPVAYLPAAAAIRTAEFLDLNVGGLLLLSRLSGVVVFVAVAGFAVNSLRRYRIAWLAFALALLPIAVFQAGTVTADTVTNALALLVSALFVKAVFLRDRLSKPETVVLLASAVLLPLCKPTYVLLALLVALVPATQLGWTRRVRPLAPAAAAIGMILFLVWTRISARTTEGMGFMRPVDEWYSVIPAEQMSHVLGDPLNFVATFLQTMMIRDQLYFVQFFGELGFS
ncbi:MAG: DUF2142 domain-containing protein, partial [Rhodococcus sp. (in: high G+C Gram-positive bacteria)]|uniref:DUF2142 domain-containing protein n=1 Tax=Rhodococcus sp. TaxID=1831 RepID=UPI003BB198B9